MGSGLKEGEPAVQKCWRTVPEGQALGTTGPSAWGSLPQICSGALLQVLPLLQSVSEFLPNKDEFLKNYKCPCVIDMFSDLPCLLKNPNHTNQITKASKQMGQSVAKQIWFLWFWPDCREGKPSILCLACSSITVYRKGDKGAWKHTEPFPLFLLLHSGSLPGSYLINKGT